jgi:hypothetical protein
VNEIRIDWIPSMQVLPKMSRTPTEILNLPEDYSVEALHSCYRVALQRAGEKRTLETAAQGEMPTVAEIEWAYKELLALVKDNFSSDEGESVVSAVLLPGLNQTAVESMSRRNVVSLPVVKRSFDATHRTEAFPKTNETDFSLPELKEILDNVAREVAMPQSQPQDFNRSFGAQNRDTKIDARVFVKTVEGYQPSSPLSSRNVAPILTTPKTIRTVIGGEDKPVVNTVASKGLSKEAQAQYQTILASAERAHGGLLKQLRDVAQIDSWELSQRTRISLEHLAAVEGDDFDSLPAPVYYRGFVTSYLKYLGINRPDLVEALCEAYRTQKRNRSNRTK